MDAFTNERELLIRDKYDGDTAADLTDDLARLQAGEPLAYVIGWTPFMGLRIGLESKPLIPRPETEWWTEQLIERLRERFGIAPFTVLDLCAGSGAIGLAILKAFPNAWVSFGEVRASHALEIGETLRANDLDASRASIHVSDLFDSFPRDSFDCIATNPPYIPSSRLLEASVLDHEPSEALFAGEDGLAVIERIATETPQHVGPGSELWMECDIANIEAASVLLTVHGAATTEIRTDQYGRPRIVVGYYA